MNRPITPAMPQSHSEALEADGGLLGNRLVALLAGTLILAAVCVGLWWNTFLFLLLGACLMLAMTPWAASLSLLGFGITLAFGTAISEYRYDAGPFNVYGVDYVVLVLLWTGCRWLGRTCAGAHHGQPLVASERRLVALLWVWGGVGVLALANGWIVHGYRTDLAFGDFRRYCFYMFAFLAPLYLPFDSRHIRALPWIVITSGAIVAGLIVYRLTYGIPARIDVENLTGYVGTRPAVLVECMTLAVAYTFLAASLRQQTGVIAKTFAVVGCCILIGLLFLSGWRLAMGLAVGVPLAVLLMLSWARHESLSRTVELLGLGILIVVIGVVVLFLTAPGLVEQTLLNLYMRLVNTEDFRPWAWGQALEYFLQKPVFGLGFGKTLTFPFRTTAGHITYTVASGPHNMFLKMLYQTGIVGFVPFALFHAGFAVYALAHLRTVRREFEALYVALFVGWLGYMGYAMLQPWRVAEYPITYMVMGMMIVCVRLSRESQAIAPTGEGSQCRG